MQNLPLILICLALVSQQSFVDTAPISQGITTDNVLEKDSDVQQLENLKKSLVKENGELIARLDQHVDTIIPAYNKSATKIERYVDIPSKEIRKSIVQLSHDLETLTRNDNGHTPAPTRIYPSSKTTNTMERIDIQYSPLDMAEYVFWTGDEKGVTLSIEEFLQEGLMTREEAISFLQEIKYNLEYLKSHYTELGLDSKQHSKVQGVKSKPLKYTLNKVYEKPELNNNFEINQLRQAANKKRVLESTQSLSIMNKNDGTSKMLEGDSDILLDRLRIADFLYTEYSLEEIIYQLAKVMFTQSLTHGSAEAQQALQKFTNFLEVEAKQGHISKALEKKILDVLIASLSDTLTDHPELLIAAEESLGPTTTNADGQRFIKQILELISTDKPNIKDLFVYNQQKSNNQKHNELNESNTANQAVHAGFEKYRNNT